MKVKVKIFGIAIVYLLCGANIYLTFILDSWFWDAGKGFNWWLFIILCLFWPFYIFETFSSKSYEIASNAVRKIPKEIEKWFKFILQRH